MPRPPSSSASIVSDKHNPSGSSIATYVPGGPTTPFALDGSGNVWTIGTKVYKYSPTFTLTGSYAPANLKSPRAIAIDAEGNVWITNQGYSTIVQGVFGAVTKLSSTGATLGTYAVGDYPDAIAIDGADNAWVTNSNYGNPSSTVTRISK